MPVYHFIYHAYGTWHPDHPDGWHQHGVFRPLRAHQATADYRRAVQKFPTVNFDENCQHALIDMAIDACRERALRCHAVAANLTHIHIVASWYRENDAKKIHETLKRLLGWRCAKVHGVAGRRWISHGGYPTRVKDGEHLSYLLREYLPEQGGTYWKEGDAIATYQPRVDGRGPEGSGGFGK